MGFALSVCMRGVVCDPMVGEPKHLAEYQTDVFTEPVKLSEYISTDKIEIFLNR